VLLIADSCYTGAMLRGAGEFSLSEAREQALLKSLAKKKRTVITSGANEPVLDGGGGNHSIFARALLEGLGAIEDPVFSADELFVRNLRPRVSGNAQQEPRPRTGLTPS